MRLVPSGSTLQVLRRTGRGMLSYVLPEMTHKSCLHDRLKFQLQSLRHRDQHRSSITAEPRNQASHEEPTRLRYVCCHYSVGRPVNQRCTKLRDRIRLVGEVTTPPRASLTQDEGFESLNQHRRPMIIHYIYHHSARSRQIQS